MPHSHRNRRKKIHNADVNTSSERNISVAQSNSNFFNLAKSFFSATTTTIVSATTTLGFFGASMADSVGYENHVFLNTNSSSYIKLDLIKPCVTTEYYSGCAIPTALLSAEQQLVAMGYQLVSGGIDIAFQLVKDLQATVRIYQETGKPDPNIENIITIFNEVIKNMDRDSWILTGVFGIPLGLFAIVSISLTLGCLIKSKCSKRDDYTEITESQGTTKKQCSVFNI